MTFDLTPWAKPTDPFVLVERQLVALGSRRGDGNEWQCPNHEDDVQSFGIERGDVWPVVMHCFADCTYVDLLNALQIDSDTFNGTKKYRYNYYDEQGTLSYFVKRTDQWLAGEDKGGEAGTVDRVHKTIQPSWMDKDGKTRVGLPKKVTRLLYNMPQVLAASWQGKDVWLVEGEHCADIGNAYAAQNNAPLVFTTAHGGAERAPLKGMLDALANGNGARVTIMRDNDLSSIRWALRWHDALRERGVKSRIVKGLGEGKGDDLFNHLEQGAKLNAVVGESIDVLRALTDVEEPVEEIDLGETPTYDGQTWPPPSMPLDVAEQYLRRFVRVVSDLDGARRFASELYYWREQWWAYSEAKGIWEALEKAQLDVYMSETLGHANCRDGTPWHYSTKTRDEVERQLRSCAFLPSEYLHGAWLIHGRELTHDEEHGNWVACRSGLLNLKTRELRPLSPEFFGHRLLDYTYDPYLSTDEKRARIARWLEFLYSIWGKGSAEIRLLQEWFGYVVMGDVSLEKALMFIGPRRAGKGTIVDVLTALVGRNAKVGLSLAQLGSQFGPSVLLDKSLAVFGDARFAGSDKVQSETVERILNITGLDDVSIDIKRKALWSGRLGVRIMVTTNELPVLRENSGAYTDRFEILKIDDSKSLTVAQQDPDLKDALRYDQEGLGVILDWALDGYDRLRRQNHFTATSSGSEAKSELEHLSNPVRAFIDDCLVPSRSEEDRVSMAVLWNLWDAWTDRTKVPKGNQITFGRDLAASRILGPQVRWRVTDASVTQGVRMVRGYKNLRVVRTGVTS